jgi:UDP-glucose 4-epimerase
MMRVLITGGAGFIGSHLAEALLETGHSVSVIDDLSTGSIQNIEHLKLGYSAVNGTATTHWGRLSVVASGSSKFQYIIDSVTNVPLMAELVDQCDVVYHLAAAVGVKLIVESPVRTIETNVRGSEVVLQLANKKKKKVFVASTSEVYGKASKVPFSEDDDLVMGPTVKGRWAYACSKALDEFLAIAYWKEKRLPVVVVRLFNTVGPRQTGQYGMVLPSFVRQALRNKPITVYGNGKQSRSFTYVGDVVEALIKLADCDRAVGQVLNIGNAEEIAIEDLARRVKALAVSHSPIEYIPYAMAYEEGFEDMVRRVPDISKIRGYIGWEPRVQLNEMIEKVIGFEREKLREEEGVAVSTGKLT